MPSDHYVAIGLMSGTSLDGLDIAACQFAYIEHQWRFQIVATETLPYSEDWQAILQELPERSGPEIQYAHAAYGRFLGNVAAQFINRHSIEVDFIASHGHTLFHQPDRNYTFQLGSGAHLASSSKQLVISDFRTQDVALGGQGAPLVPIGDKLLFQSFAQCLNLGGFANVSYETPAGRTAFDIGPANLLLNHVVAEVDLLYDAGGKLAQSGELLPELLAQLNALPFYAQAPPKSLGREWLEAELLPLVDAFQASAADKARTCCEHIAQQIGKVLSAGTEGNVLITGGGAHNDFLIERIRFYSSNPISVPNSAIVDFKEALVFAFLGVLRLRNENNCLASATGAAKDHCSGVLHFPQN